MRTVNDMQFVIVPHELGFKFVSERAAPFQKLYIYIPGLESTLFGIHTAVLDTATGSKAKLFKFSGKYHRENMPI